MGGTFTLRCDFRELDNDPSPSTKKVTIAANVTVLGDTGVIYDRETTVDVAAGVLEVDLPASDNTPNDFGYTVTRATGRPNTWRVPAQDAGTTVELQDFTASTPLPMPVPDDYVTEGQLNARFDSLGTAALADTGTTSGTVPLLGTGGRLPIARVASGTPDGTKFVRDDGTLAVPTGGGGSTPAWADVTGKPTTFPPSAHTHVAADVTDLAASIADGAGYARVNLVCDGDSNFIGGNGQVPLIYKIHTQIAEGMANTTARNFGVSGQTLADMLSDAVAQIDSLIDNTPGTLNLLVVGGGGNDLNEGSHPTAATIYARKVAYHAARRAAGWTTIDLTVLPRSLAASYGSGYETQRAALNTLIRTNWADYADGFVDSDAVPGLGTVADVADARVWADENLHISSLGVSRLVDAIKPEVARLGALTGQRQPVNRIPSGSLFIPATAFRPMSGTAPNAGEAPAASWMFPDTGTTNVLAGIEIPREWKRLRIYVWWSPYGSDGNVSHFVSLTPLVLGGDWYLGGGSAAGVGIGIGQNKVVRSQMASSPLLGSSAPTSWSVGYGRNVGDTANDTHTGSMLFLGIELVDHPLDGE